MEMKHVKLKTVITHVVMMAIGAVMPVSYTHLISLCDWTVKAAS